MNVTLTPQQKEVLLLMAEGLTSKEIAIKLTITPRTVESYKLTMYNKFRVNNSVHLMAYAFRNDLIE